MCDRTLQTREGRREAGNCKTTADRFFTKDSFKMTAEIFERQVQVLKRTVPKHCTTQLTTGLTKGREQLRINKEDFVFKF